MGIFSIRKDTEKKKKQSKKVEQKKKTPKECYGEICKHIDKMEDKLDQLILDYGEDSIFIKKIRRRLMAI